ncbi:MAG TPA: hypothetical protein VEU51_03790 [Candidatus Acidoferrales bacterium]|nr:hypothetical protein [Candidatus Acidoferrales bacterium]
MSVRIARQRQGISSNRTLDVLELLRAEILHPDLGLVANLVVNALRNADTAGLGERMNPRRDVDAVAEHSVVRKHHVADVNSDSQLQVGVVLQLGLHLARAIHGVQGAVEAGERAVADFTEHPAVEARQDTAQ